MYFLNYMKNKNTSKKYNTIAIVLLLFLQYTHGANLFQKYNFLNCCETPVNKLIENVFPILLQMPAINCLWLMVEKYKDKE